MSESKHTPGPWSVDGKMNETSFAVISKCQGYLIDGHIRVVAACRWYPRRGVNEVIDEAEANAHLIAAAPEMYQALKAAEDGDPAFVNLLRAAIAKAEGRS